MLKRVCWLWVAIIILLVQGCASSDVSRNTASQIDDAYLNAKKSFSEVGSGSVSAGYQNANQTTKGLWLGGLTGAVAGTFTSGLGLLPGILEGLVFGGALGAYIDARTDLSDQLKNRRGKVIVLGDQVLIVLPSRIIFRDMTADIMPDAKGTLNLLADLISHYPNLSVKIAAYTNASGPEAINLALSRQQAKSVLKYLWRRGVNTRLLVAEGYGGTQLVENNSLAWSSGQNYRLEITLEKMPLT